MALLSVLNNTLAYKKIKTKWGLFLVWSRLLSNRSFVICDLMLFLCHIICFLLLQFIKSLRLMSLWFTVLSSRSNIDQTGQLTAFFAWKGFYCQLTYKLMWATGDRFVDRQWSLLLTFGSDRLFVLSFHLPILFSVPWS